MKLKLILKNNIFYSIIGFHSLRNSRNNTIGSNNVKNCSRYGIFVNESSKNNIIRYSNLIKNKDNAYFNKLYPNIWFSDYWDDWDKSFPKPINVEIKLKRQDRVVPWAQFDIMLAIAPYGYIININ